MYQLYWEFLLATRVQEACICNGATLHVLATIISMVQSAVFDWNFEGLFLQGGRLLLGKCHKCSSTVLKYGHFEQ